MPHETLVAAAGVDAACQAVCLLLNSGYIRLYTGPKPATADTAITTQVQLAELRFGNPAFILPPTDGEAFANAIEPDTDCDATGTAVWFRTYLSDGATPVYDGTVDVADADMVINSTSVQAGAALSVGSFSYSERKSDP